MSIKQSICLGLFHEEISLKEKIIALKTIGFPAVEIWFRDESFDELCDLCREHDLVLSSMIGHDTLTDGLNDPANHDRIEDELKTSIDLAAANGIPGMICFSGNRRDGVSSEESIAITAEGLKRSSAYAEAKGVNLNMELLNSKVDHPAYECDNTPWGVSVIEAVNSPNVKLLYDIYHMQIMEGDVIRTLQENIDHIGHFHTAGNPGRNDLDDDQESNYRGICRAIAATGFHGYVGHEFKPKGESLPAF